MTPVAFLDRSAEVYADQLAVVDGDLRLPYRELRDRVLRLAYLLQSKGVVSGDRVAVLAPNNHVLLESHYGVPLAGAVLVALNTRLAVAEMIDIVIHAGCKMILHDPSFTASANRIAQSVGGDLDRVVADQGYEKTISAGPGLCKSVEDERGLLALNYTSGTSGSPKGVM